MEVVHLRCGHCGFRFNLQFVPGVSFSALRLGTGRSFKCPSCRVREFFDMTTAGPDPGAPTYRDPVRLGAASLALILGGGVGLAVLFSRWTIAGIPTPTAVVTVGLATVAALALMAGFTLIRSRLVVVSAGTR